MDNHDGRNKQLFLLIVGSVFCFMVFCLTGCGGGESCETPKCGNYEEDGVADVCGVSIPGCGGCLTPGSGCLGCLWPQSCKMICGSIEGYDGTYRVAAIDNRYFSDDGCCGESEKSCYSGCMGLDLKNWGCIYGSTESGEEHTIGCVNGCGGCLGSNNAYIIHNAEEILEIN